MTFDYIFFRLFKNHRFHKYKKVEDSIERSCWIITLLLHIVILPICFNFTRIFTVRDSFFHVVPYFICLATTYKYINWRYSQSKYKAIIHKYEKKEPLRIPIFFIWLWLIFSIPLGFVLAGAISHFIMQPLGLYGILNN